MAADDSPLRVACRLVCTDQWLVTHVDPSCSIAHLKHFLLCKFRRSASDPEHNPRAISVSPRKARRRSLSPITFATPPVLRKTQHVSPSSSDHSDVSEDGEYVDLDDDVNITKSITDAHRYKYNARVSTSSAADSATRLPSGAPEDTQAYTLLTFSTTQILEDRFSLSWYDIHPGELLELHPVSVSFVSLPRSSLDMYVAPYFAARVWALRIVGHWPDTAPREEVGGDAKQTSTREKSGKRKVAVEWKERWAIIYQGVFSLCKERHDTHAAFSAPLSSMLSIRDNAHFKLPAHAFRSRRKTSSGASNIVCIKFITGSSSRHRTFSNESTVAFDGRPSDPSSQALSQSISSSTSGWWKRGSQDVSAALTLGLASSASALVGTSLVGSTSGAGFGDAWGTFARKSSRAGLDDSEGEPGPSREKGRERDNGDEAVWIVLDMLDSSACSHILRVLHRHAPSTCLSTFLPTPRPTSMYSPAPSPIIFSSRSSTPAFPPTSPATPCPSSSYTFPQPGHLSSTPTNTSFPPSATSYVPYQSYHFGPARGSRPSSPTFPADVMASGRGPGVPYPAWRLSVVRTARRAGLGAVGRAMELVMFGDEDEDDLADIEDAEDDELAIEWARRTSSVEPSPIEFPAAVAPFPLQSPPLPRVSTRQSRSASDPLALSVATQTSPEHARPTPVLSAVNQSSTHVPRPRRQSHPLVDLTSLHEVDPSHESDKSEAEWDGWVDAVIAQRREDVLTSVADTRRDTITQEDAFRGPPSASEWNAGLSPQFGGATGGSSSPAVTPDREHGDERLGTWSWPRGDADGDTEESAAPDRDLHAAAAAALGAARSTPRRGTSSSSKPHGRRQAAAGRGHDSGSRTLSSYSSVDSLLRRTATMRTNIKSITLNSVKRSSMQALFPSASSSNVNLYAQPSERSGSASPPLQAQLSSVSNVRSGTHVSTRPQPFSPLASQAPDRQWERVEDMKREDGEEEEENGGHEHESERDDVDVDDVEEPGEERDERDEGGEVYGSEFGHPVPLPGMRMVPSGYTTFQHSSLYGQGNLDGEERTHAGLVHGQSMQRLPMGMTRMMTTVSSTVSVGPSARRGKR